VGVLLTSPLREPRDQAEHVERLAWEAGVPVHPVTAGTQYRFDPALDITVLWPRRVITESSAPNNTSVVLDVTAHGLRLLLTGDAEVAAQVAVRGASGSGGFDVVKVPHHGSGYFDPAFPAWVRPRVALITVGRGNGYGHPAPEAVAAWSSNGAVIGRTDADGALAVVTDASGHLVLVSRGVRE